MSAEKTINAVVVITSQLSFRVTMVVLKPTPGRSALKQGRIRSNPMLFKKVSWAAPVKDAIGSARYYDQKRAWRRSSG